MVETQEWGNLNEKRAVWGVKPPGAPLRVVGTKRGTYVTMHSGLTVNGQRVPTVTDVTPVPDANEVWLRAQQQLSADVKAEIKRTYVDPSHPRQTLAWTIIISTLVALLLLGGILYAPA